MWRFEWRTGEALTDLFEDDEFLNETKGDERVHAIEGPRGGRSITARYKIRVQGKTAWLSYFRCSENDRALFNYGRYIVHFTSIRRTQVLRVDWQPEGRKAAIKDVVQALKVDDTPHQQPGSPSKQSRWSRPEQARLRRLLGLAYAERCCITGCGVRAALEAAHIKPYVAGEKENPSNAILLRADLHALFDTGHLAVDPETLKIHMSQEALGWKQYRALHRRATLRSPQASHARIAPSPDAFKHRWLQFSAAHSEKVSRVRGTPRSGPDRGR